MNISNFLFSFLLLLTLSTATAGGSVGINYGRIADDLPTPAAVVQLLKNQGITKAKLYDTDSTVLSAFANSGISLTVALPNELLSSAAANSSFTDAWVRSNILSYHPATTISAVAVGNEVFVDPQNTTDYLVPAMKNVYASLAAVNLSSVKVSSPLALSALQTSYPSSSGSFKPDLVEPVIKPMLEFLNQTGSYLMVNAYPFFAYVANTDTISLDYALLRGGATPNKDPNNGLQYKSLFEAQTDAVFAAMGALGFQTLDLVITETGWPSKGDEGEIGASAANAEAYNGNLVRRVLSGGGTPLRPEKPLNVFLFALFNEDLKTGPTSERNYGLFYPNQKKVYDIPLTVEALASGPNLTETKVKVEAVAPTAADSAATWCVANEKAAEEKVQEAMDYACGEGGADCRPIQKGATCYDPNTVAAHASYAFNSYYQKNSRRSGTCDFGGAAYVVTHSPKFGSCEFPTGY